MRRRCAAEGTGGRGGFAAEVEAPLRGGGLRRRFAARGGFAAEVEAPLRGGGNRGEGRLRRRG